MIVGYNWGTNFKTDKILGENKCENCGYHTKKYLVREFYVFNLFLIPILRKTIRKGIMCSHCGKIEKLGRQDYNNAKMSDIS